MTVLAGNRVEWVSPLAATASITGLVCLTEHPVRQPRTGRAPDPLTNSLGFDGGRMVPVRVCRRQFAVLGGSIPVLGQLRRNG